MSIKLGTKDILGIYIGTTPVDKLYLGSTTVYDGGGSDYGPEPNPGDKLLVLNAENGSLEYGNLVRTSSGLQGEISSTQAKFGSNSIQFDSYTDSSSTLDYKKLEYTIPVNNLGRAWTFELWYYPLNYNDGGNAIGLQINDLTNNDYNLGWFCASDSFYINSKYISKSQSATVTYSAWNHAAITYDPTSGFKCYENGVLTRSYTIHNFFRNSHQYAIKFYAIRGYSSFVDSINWEYGVKYIGDMYTLPTTAPQETPLFTPSGEYADITEQHTLTYTSEYPATLNGVTLPISTPTTESALINSLLPDDLVYTGSDTTYNYLFKGWQTNGADVSTKDAILTDITLTAKWELVDPNSLYVMSSYYDWEAQDDLRLTLNEDTGIYKIQNFNLYGEWVLGNTDLSIKWGAKTKRYKIQSNTPYTAIENGKNFYSQGEYVKKLTFDPTTHEIRMQIL